MSSAVKTEVTAFRIRCPNVPLEQDEHSGIPISQQEEASFKDQLNSEAINHQNGSLDYSKWSFKERANLRAE